MSNDAASIRGWKQLRFGAWYFPPLASLITSGGRLLLAIPEKSVQLRKGRYLFCDTDSLCIVGSQKGGFVECPCGPLRRNRKLGINAASGHGLGYLCAPKERKRTKIMTKKHPNGYWKLGIFF
jgi:hypothetical protein